MITYSYTLLRNRGHLFMKKKILLLLGLVCVLPFFGCGKKTIPLQLPKMEEVQSIVVTEGESTIQHVDKTWIREVIAAFSYAQPTRKESVQDTPQVEEYMQIDFQSDTGITTLFVYEEKGKYYVEQPYHGIYEIHQKQFTMLGTK